MSETLPPDDGELSEPLDALSIQVAGAMARQYAEDTRGFLRHLASFLTGALGEDGVRLQRAGLFGGDSRPIKRIEFEMADATGGKAARYAIEDAHGRVTATRTQVVRGIALKTEPLPVEDWIQEVGAAIAGEVERNKAARNALRDLL